MNYELLIGDLKEVDRKRSQERALDESREQVAEQLREGRGAELFERVDDLFNDYRRLENVFSIERAGRVKLGKGIETDTLGRGDIIYGLRVYNSHFANIPSAKMVKIVNRIEFDFVDLYKGMKMRDYHPLREESITKVGHQMIANTWDRLLEVTEPDDLAGDKHIVDHLAVDLPNAERTYEMVLSAVLNEALNPQLARLGRDHYLRQDLRA